MKTYQPQPDLPGLQSPAILPVDYARVVIVSNPFEPFDSMDVHDLHNLEKLTITGFLKSLYGQDFVDFEKPTIVILNGHPYSRISWDTYRIQKGDLIQVITVVGDVVSIVIAVVTILIAILVVALVPTPTIPGGQPQPDPIFTRNGQYNRSRPGQPIEVGYGRCRLFPSYAARSYTKYENNDQYQFNLLCLGQGYWDIEQINIGDSPIENFEEVEVEIVPPGGTVTLFRNNVETSAEVGSIELFGPNEESYDEWTGPFVLNAAGTETDLIEMDMVCPNGLFRTNTSGKLLSESVTFEFEVIKVDASGVIIDGEAWANLGTITLTATSTTPVRKTYSFVVDLGRYQARARRISDKSSSIRVNHTLQWAAARAYLPNVLNYGEVTMMAVKVRATNNLNDNTRSLFNVWATRKLPTYDTVTGTWQEVTEATAPTRSIILAFCDIFRAQYGGRDLGRFLNMEQLMELDELYTERGEYFDWIFDQPTTVSDAAKAIARVGRGVPTMLGNRMGIVRDAAASLPSAIFTPDIIVSGSFRRDFKFFEFDPYDCVQIEYRNPTTWEPEFVTCALPESFARNPQLITLTGCQDRNHAYREGMFIAASNRYIRERLSFTTGMEGHIPQYGDLIAISHDLIRVGSCGLIQAVDNETLPGQTILILSDPVSFDGSATYVVVIRKKNGEVFGPVEVEAITDEVADGVWNSIDSNKKIVTVGSALTLSDFFIDDEHELPIFQFGQSERYSKLAKVSSLRPSGKSEVEVECINYDARIHSFDDWEAPALPGATVPPPFPAAPVASGLRVITTVENPTLITIAWNAAYGAKSYILQQSADNVTWEDIAITGGLSTSLVVTAGDIWLRLAAVNVGQGPWVEISGEVGIPLSPPAPPTGFANTNTWELDAEFAWDPIVSGGFDLTVKQFDTGTTIHYEEFGAESLTWTYTRAMAAADGADRKLTFVLRSVNLAGESSDVELVLENALPTAPTGLTNGTPTGTVYPISWTCPDLDISTYKVYKSTTDGFTPGPGNLHYTGATPSTTIDTGGVTTYWKVAAIDVWGTEEVLSAQKTI